MDWMYLFYFLLGILLFYGARFCGKGQWNEDYTSLKQTKILQGIAALGIVLHHLSQKSAAPWHKAYLIVHGLDFFIPIGYLFVAIFLFCSGMGLYKSLKAKENYLHGFVRRRILPMVIAYYLAEFIHLGVRLLMGQKMNTTEIIWYISGLHMANENGWYMVIIPFFYLVFFLAFRFCKKEGTAIGWIFLFILAYTAFGASLDHQSDWWMRGEWWYNSVIVFPLGILFAKYEARITAFFKKGYWLWLVFAFAAVFGLFHLSCLAQDDWWGYYGDGWDKLAMVHRLGCAGMQWLVCIVFVAFCFLLMMKLRFENRILVFLGGLTLDLYLIHGMFVEMFGYNFLEITKSVWYIKNVALYSLVVLACSIPAALLFRLLRKGVTSLAVPRKPKESAPSA